MSSPGVRAVRPLVCPYRHPEFESRHLLWAVSGFQGFYRFPSFIPKTISTSIILYSHAFILCYPSSHSWLGKNSYTSMHRMIAVHEHRHSHIVTKIYLSPSLSFPKPAHFSLHCIVQCRKQTFVYLSNHHLYTEMQLKRINSKIYSLFVIVRSF